MVELVFGAVGGHVGHIEAVAAAAADHGGVALVQLQAHAAINGALGALDEAIEGILERAVPKPLVHQVGPGHFELALGAQHVGGQGEAFQFLVGLDQQQQTRGFVDLPALDAHHPVFDHVEPAEAMAAGQGVGAANQADRIEAHAIDRHRIALLKGDLHHLGRIGGGLDRAGHRVDLLGRFHHRILEGTRFDAAAEQVEVD